MSTGRLFLLLSVLPMFLISPGLRGQEDQGTKKVSLGKILESLKENYGNKSPVTVRFQTYDARPDEGEMKLYRGLLNRKKDGPVRLEWSGTGHTDRKQVALTYRGLHIRKNELDYRRWWVRGSNSWIVSSTSSSVVRKGAPFVDMFETSNPAPIAASPLLFSLAPALLRANRERIQVTAEERNGRTYHRVHLAFRPAVASYRLSYRLYFRPGSGRLTEVQIRRHPLPEFPGVRPLELTVSVRGYSEVGGMFLPSSVVFVHENHPKRVIDFHYEMSGEHSTAEWDPVYRWRKKHTENPEELRKELQDASEPSAGQIVSLVDAIVRSEKFDHPQHFLRRFRVRTKSLEEVVGLLERGLRRKPGSVAVNERAAAYLYSTRGLQDRDSREKGLRNMESPSRYVRLLQYRNDMLRDTSDTGESDLEVPTSSYLFEPVIKLFQARRTFRKHDGTAQLVSSFQRHIKDRALLEGSLFVEEFIRRLRGTEKKESLLNKKGVQVLKELSGLSGSDLYILFLARLHSRTGYFKKAGEHYARLSKRRELQPEIKRFILDRGRKAPDLIAKVIEEMDRPDLYLYHIRSLYSTDRERAISLVTELIDSLRRNPDFSFPLHAKNTLKALMEKLLETGEKKRCRHLMKYIMKHESGMVLAGEQFRGLVRKAFGSSLRNLYSLIRHATVPMNVEPFLPFSKALEYARDRLKNREGTETDAEFLVRLIFQVPDLAFDPGLISTILERQTKKYPKNILLQTRFGDLLRKMGLRSRAANAYKKALEARANALKNAKSPYRDQITGIDNYYSVPDHVGASGDLDIANDQPLILKQVLLFRKMDKTKEARRLLAEYQNLYTDRDRWAGVSSSVLTRVNRERQYLAWGFFFAGNPNKAKALMKEAYRMESKEYPAGQYGQSATRNYLVLLDQQKAESKINSFLRSAVERYFRRPSGEVDYDSSILQEAVRRYQKKETEGKVVQLLRRVARAEWRNPGSYLFKDSAGNQLYERHLESQNPEKALGVLVRSYRRELAERKRSLPPDSASLALVNQLSSRGRKPAALIVCRLVDEHKRTGDPLKTKLLELDQSTGLEKFATVLFNQEISEPSERITKTARTQIKRLSSNSMEERMGAINELVNIGKKITPVLKSAMESADKKVRERILRVLKEIAIQDLRRRYGPGSLPVLTLP